MSYPFFKKGLVPGERSVAASAIASLPRAEIDKPEAYIPHPDLSHAVNVALILGMPLLVTGEPGTGKTQLASVVAHELACPLWKFETQSTSLAKDLFYTFDALTAFKAQQMTDVRAFITYQALGRAIIEAFPPTHPRIQALQPAVSENSSMGPRRAVVLIDEIDKAPRDFPNDLLNQIDRLYFRIPELGNLGTPGSEEGEAGVPEEFRPIILITSNSEKGLPDPFLRRCVYYDIPFPTDEQMKEIVAARLQSQIGGNDPLLADAIDLFYALRRQRKLTTLKKEPSTAELINWLQVLFYRGVRPGELLRTQKSLVRETLTCLVKNADDRRTADEFVQNRW